MPGSLPSPVTPLVGPGTFTLGQVYPGGSLAIVSNSLANPTLVTTLCPHGLASGDTIFWTSSAVSVPLLTVTPQQVVTVVSPTTFTIPVNCTTGGTSGSPLVSEPSGIWSAGYGITYRELAPGSWDGFIFNGVYDSNPPYDVISPAPSVAPVPEPSSLALLAAALLLLAIHARKRLHTC